MIPQELLFLKKKRIIMCRLFEQKVREILIRWLDTGFQGQYLPSLSIDYVAINNVLEKLSP